MDTVINDYAESNKLEIVSISVVERWDTFTALVLFRKLAVTR